MATSTEQLPGQRRRRSLSIIDITDIDELRPPARRRRLEPRANPTTSTAAAATGNPEEPIIINDDSDESSPVANTIEEVEITRYVPAPAQDLRSPRARRRYRSPPAPSAGPSTGPIPPVPPLPPGFIHASAHPYPFEIPLERYYVPSRSTSPQLPPRAAARSHHTPSMGFGGAILALTRPVSDWINSSMWRTTAAEPVPQVHNAPVQEHGLRRDRDRRYRMNERMVRMTMRHMMGTDDMNIPGPVERTYKIEYTHPRPVEPGYVKDFPQPKPVMHIIEEREENDEERRRAMIRKGKQRAVSHSLPTPPPSISEETETEIMVCASCVTPLILGGGAPDTKIYALEGCGHVLCGACIKLSVDSGRSSPPPESDAEHDPYDFGEPVPLPTRQLRLRAGTGTWSDATYEYPPLPRLKSSLKRKGQPAKKVRAPIWNCPVAKCGKAHSLGARIKGVGKVIPLFV